MLRITKTTQSLVASASLALKLPTRNTGSLLAEKADWSANYPNSPQLWCLRPTACRQSQPAGGEWVKVISTRRYRDETSHQDLTLWSFSTYLIGVDTAYRAVEPPEITAGKIPWLWQLQRQSLQTLIMFFFFFLQCIFSSVSSVHICCTSSASKVCIEPVKLVLSTGRF